MSPLMARLASFLEPLSGFSVGGHFAQQSPNEFYRILLFLDRKNEINAPSAPKEECSTNPSSRSGFHCQYSSFGRKDSSMLNKEDFQPDVVELMIGATFIPASSLVGAAAMFSLIAFSPYAPPRTNKNVTTPPSAWIIHLGISFSYRSTCLQANAYKFIYFATFYIS